MAYLQDESTKSSDNSLP